MRRLAFVLTPGWRGIWTGLLCALAVWGMALSPLGLGLENWMLDGLFILRGRRATSARVVIVTVDETSLRKLDKSAAYLSPELAEVVRHAHAQGARAIGVDLLVPENMSALRDIAEAGAIGDARPMGDAVRKSGNVVLPRWRIDESNGDDRGEIWLRPLLQWQFKALNDDLKSDTDLASVHLFEDGDQFVRRVQLLAGENDVRDDSKPDTIIHFGLALYLVAHRQPLEVIDRDPVVAGRRVPVDHDGLMRINYVGPPGSFKTIPFHEVLQAARTNRLVLEFKDSVVLIGMTAHRAYDDHATPFSNLHARWLPGKTARRMSGTEVHASVLATLEDQAYITTPWWMAPLPSLLLAGALLGYVFSRATVLGGLLVATGHHFAWKGLALLAFVQGNYRLPVLGMILLGVAVYAASYALRWRFARRLLELFKSRKIARALEQQACPGGRLQYEREVTVLFADIRGFTTYSDGRPPRQVANLLMAYFNVVVPIIEKHGGALNQYMGDGMMVLFGALEEQDDHALRAVRAAVEMAREVNLNRREWREHGMPRLRIGVGINTGLTVVGSIGSCHRMDFTAIGQTTNIAARIEALNKDLQTEVLISEQTWRELPPDEAVQLGCETKGREVSVRGKAASLRVHAVIVPRGSETSLPGAAGAGAVAGG